MRSSELSVYVIHGRRLAERRARLERELASQGLDALWVTDPDAEELPRSLRRRYYRGSRWLWRRRSWVTGPSRFRKLGAREIAVTIAHIQTLESVATGGCEWALVLEDDAVLAPDFAERFDEYFEQLPADADLVYIGSCCDLHVAEVEAGRHFYRKDHPATKCADSYLVSRRAAGTLAATIVPFVLPIDWELNYQLRLHDLVVYWLEPPLVSQGSQTGVHTSSLRQE